MQVSQFPSYRQRFDGSTELRQMSALKRSTALTPRSEALPASRLSVRKKRQKREGLQQSPAKFFNLLPLTISSSPTILRLTLILGS
jgi:hypothetical protein